MAPYIWVSKSGRFRFLVGPMILNGRCEVEERNDHRLTKDGQSYR